MWNPFPKCIHFFVWQTWIQKVLLCMSIWQTNVGYYQQRILFALFRHPNSPHLNQPIRDLFTFLYRSESDQWEVSPGACINSILNNWQRIWGASITDFRFDFSFQLKWGFFEIISEARSHAGTVIVGVIRCVGQIVIESRLSRVEVDNRAPALYEVRKSVF